MDRVLGVIHNLSLDMIPNDWVDSVFTFEFTGFGDIPPDYAEVLESIQIQPLFENLIELINEVEDFEENSWAVGSQVISIRNLLAVLGHYITQGTKHVTAPVHRIQALLAARTYFRLLLFPGARAYDVYHSQLFALSISCLGFPKLMCEKSDHYKNNKHLSDEVNNVLNGLSEYVVDLRCIILKLALTPADIDFEDILSNLVDVTGGAITQTLNSVDKILMANVSSVIYQVINCMLCNYSDQPNPEAIQLLFKCMVPKLIASSADTRAPTGYMRASYVTYAGVILTRYCKASVKSFIIMLEHLCHTLELLERAEARNARADLVVGLMSLLPDRRHRKFVKWVLILSTTAKITHRQVALEILARLLNNEPEINEQRETIRCEIQKQNAAANALTNGNIRPLNVMEDDTSSQDSQESKENEEPEDAADDEVAGLLRMQPHTVPLGQILHAVYECAYDVASAVRQRAYAVLAESAASQRGHMGRALQELNGDGTVSRLMALGARGVCDVRAVVRRIAAGLVHSLLRARPEPVTANDLAILIGLCRDAAVTVRTVAINGIYDLVTYRPSAELIDGFIAGPVLQLSDPESKVQDQVKGHIEQMLVKRLEKYTEGCIEDPLPWMFLDGIIKHNKRRSLLKACDMLAKSESSISVRLVDILSSHLGVKDDRRDLQCLVLLTCVAPHVDYSNIGFVLDYYYKMTAIPDAGNVEPVHSVVGSRQIMLTLDLLSSWARFAKGPDRAALRDHLVRRLASGPDDGCRIQTAVLAKVLDPSNLIWANELLQLSQQRALETRCIKEALRAADLSIVASTPPSPDLMKLFLDTLKNPPQEWSAAMAGECVAGAGRLSVRSRGLAGLAAPQLAGLLHSIAPMQARVNALLTLSDITQRYPNIVEPLMGTICKCLETDVPAELRRAAVRSLTELLLSGFIRLRTPLYYNYFALLADDDHVVRDIAEYYVTSWLKSVTIYQNFVDCVLHYNGNDHGLNFDARQLIYDVMLQRLNLVQKLNIQCRLAGEILEHAADLVDDDELLPESLHAALLDTIKLITGPRMRLPRKPQQTADVADIDELQERVTTNIVSHKMKRTVAEVMVPAVMRLYARLNSGGGQLAAYLVLLVQDLEIDYEQEIVELLENDEDLMRKVAAFRENHAVETTTGNMRNLVTSSGPPEPVTPKPQRKRAPRREMPKKRSLKI